MLRSVPLSYRSVSAHGNQFSVFALSLKHLFNAFTKALDVKASRSLIHLNEFCLDTYNNRTFMLDSYIQHHKKYKHSIVRVFVYFELNQQ